MKNDWQSCLFQELLWQTEPCRGMLEAQDRLFFIAVHSFCA